MSTGQFRITQLFMTGLSNGNCLGNFDLGLIIFLVCEYNEAKTTANTGYLQVFKIKTSCHIKFMPNMPLVEVLYH